MQTPNARQTLLDLTDLETRYWHDVDHNWGRKAHEFFSNDGLFVIGDKRMCGREEIAEFYTWRESRGPRTARHIVTNFFLSDLGESHARLECILCLYAEDGVPVHESRPPIMLADIVNEYVRTDEGGWLFASHVLKPLFVGAEIPAMRDPVRRAAPSSTGPTGQQDRARFMPTRASDPQ